MSKLDKFVLIVVLLALLLTVALECDVERSVAEAKEGWAQFTQLTRSRQCLGETLEHGQSDACRGH